MAGWDATDELARLHAIDGLSILDTEPDPAYDDVVALAAHVCDTPMAFVGLLDTDRFWLKARVGLDVTELPRDGIWSAFGDLGSDGVAHIADLSADPELAVHPYVATSPNIRFIASTWVRTADGIPVGALCVVDTKPRELDARQRDMLHILGRQIEHLFALRQALRVSSAAHADLTRNQAQLQRILDAITQGVVVHAADGTIEQANPAAERILGLTEEQMRGRSPIDTRWQAIHRDGTPFPGDEHPASVALRYGVEVHDVTFGVARPDGERRWVLVNAAPLPLPGDEALGAVATFSDITDLTELNDQLRELAEAAQERAALLSAVSHDIRAPLASIRMMTEILEDRADAITLEQRHELIHRVRVEARRTEGVLVDLVSANRVGAGLNTPRRMRVDLDEIVRHTVREFSNDDHDVRLGELDGNLILWADRAQIERILDNLISNSVRHTPAGSHIIVSAVEREGAVRLSVSDNGPGVPDHLKSSIFGAYVRGERSADRPGSGLGLFLVQQFAQFHGGRAWCEDVPGGGARFMVTLPHSTARRER